MSPDQVYNPFNLLGQEEKSAAAVHLSGRGSPQLHVGWGDFRQSLASSAFLLFGGPPAPKKFQGGKFFRDCWIEGRIPRRAVVAAALWHIVFFVVPFPLLPVAPRKNHAFDNIELTWSGPINDLPLLEIPAEKAKPSPRGQPEKPLPPKGADAFHPRQRIFTDSVHPTHPRQTLINSAAPPEPPKFLPNLPNIVQLPAMAGPARPRLPISEKTLAALRPRVRRVATVKTAPLPDAPSLDQHFAELTLPASPNAPAKPKLELNAGSAPRLAPRKQTGDVGPAPDVGAAQATGANSNPSAFIALSATPAPPAPVQPPQGNLSARISVSPEGKKPGVPSGSPTSTPGANGNALNSDAKTSPESAGGTAGGGAGKNSLGVSISGGDPPARSGVSGLAGGPVKLSAPSPRSLVTRPDPRANIAEEPERTGPPDFAALPPGAKPEDIFASKKIYTLYVNMPNLNSATGSWILNFSELRINPDAPHVTSPDVAAPVPMKKIDPKYPPSLRSDRVEGEVILYAVIRRDGSVDSIQLVRGLDEQLDANAMDALSQWKFHPASKQGEPVELEAIVHIPFHLPESFKN
ncbi:MAG: TonB family protein [Candidatus Acidiferrum sp.]